MREGEGVCERWEERNKIINSSVSIAPSPAQNLTATFNDTHIAITWDNPANPNGIVNYNVEIEEADILTNEAVIIFTEVVTDTQLVVEQELAAYFKYTVNVTSQTIAGEGETVTVSFITPEEGVCVCVCVHYLYNSCDDYDERRG